MTEHNLEEEVKRIPLYVRFSTEKYGGPCGCAEDCACKPVYSTGQEILDALKALNQKEGWTVAEFDQKIWLLVEESSIPQKDKEGKDKGGREDNSRKYLFAAVEEEGGAAFDDFHTRDKGYEYKKKGGVNEELYERKQIMPVYQFLTMLDEDGRGINPGSISYSKHKPIADEVKRVLREELYKKLQKEYEENERRLKESEDWDCDS